jgi:hypothetical protein
MRMSHEEIFDSLKDRIQNKFLIYYPSFRKNPPTEANIVSTLIEVMSAKGYYCYNQVPLDLGLVDYLAILLEGKSISELFFVEAKVPKDDKKVLMDFQRLEELRKEKADEYSKLNPTSTSIRIFSVLWTENINHKNRWQKRINATSAKNDPFTEILKSCPYKVIKEIKNEKEEADLWIIYFGKDL